MKKEKARSRSGAPIYVIDSDTTKKRDAINICYNIREKCCFFRGAINTRVPFHGGTVGRESSAKWKRKIREERCRRTKAGEKVSGRALSKAAVERFKPTFKSLGVNFRVFCTDATLGPQLGSTAVLSEMPLEYRMLGLLAEPHLSLIRQQAP